MSSNCRTSKYNRISISKPSSQYQFYDRQTPEETMNGTLEDLGIRTTANFHEIHLEISKPFEF